MKNPFVPILRGGFPSPSPCFSIAAYAALFQDLGYLISTFGLLVVQLRWVEKQSWRLSLLTAGMAAVISLVVFRVFLKVPLPPAGW
jgi:hypothetical protein